MSERIGIFGGTFNPIHRGHVTVGRAVLEQFALSRLVLIPTYRPPHKSSEDLAPGADRLAMCRLAVEDTVGIEVSDVELRRPGPSYTVDTLDELRRLWPEAELCLVIGADMLRDFHLWHRAAEIAATVRLIALPRPDVAIGPLRELRELLGDAAVERILAGMASTPLVDVSSTAVRERLASGEPIDDLVPPSVARYIGEHRLYR